MYKEHSRTYLVRINLDQKISQVGKKVLLMEEKQIKNTRKQKKSVNLENNFCTIISNYCISEFGAGEVTEKFNGFDIKIRPEQIKIWSILKDAANCISKEKRTA